MCAPSLFIKLTSCKWSQTNKLGTYQSIIWIISWDNCNVCEWLQNTKLNTKAPSNFCVTDAASAQHLPLWGLYADLHFNKSKWPYVSAEGNFNLMSTLEDLSVNRDSWDSDWYVQLGMSATLLQQLSRRWLCSEEFSPGTGNTNMKHWKTYKRQK